MSFGRNMLSHWTLDPGVTYLNHGTVGVVPKKVQAVQQQLRDEMERQPSQFMLRAVSRLAGRPQAGPTRIRMAAAAVADFIGARADDVVFVDNTTAGVNAVLRSFPLDSGDEILVSDHNYGATLRVATFVARERKASLRTIPVPYPMFDRDRLIAAYEAAIGPRTRIAVLDHITSETALIFPVAEIAAICRARGVATLVDAAHAPGSLDLNVPALGVDWYVANLHKWAQAPRSCGLLWAHPSRQANLHPAVISWGLDQGFVAEFDWVGTRDPTPWLAAPAGLAFLNELGFESVRRYNHDLAWRAACVLSRRWGAELGFSEPDVACMATIPLPEQLGSAQVDAAQLRDALLDDNRIETQIHARNNRLWLRVSTQVYNDWTDIERLSDAIERRLR
jgi:isopenicillin-N epimerase